MKANKSMLTFPCIFHRRIEVRFSTFAVDKRTISPMVDRGLNVNLLST